MLAVLFAAVALVLAAAAVGHAICALAGLRGPAWAPAVGVAALMVLARAAIALPGRATTGLVVVAVVVVASLAWRPTRAGLATAVLERVPLALGSLLVVFIPFLVAGRAGILGMNRNNDMSAHLQAAWWLGTHSVPRPTGAPGDPLLDEGYPLGPHALVNVLSHATGTSLEHAFNGLMIAVPIIVAVSALAAMPSAAPRLARWPAAGLVGFGYLSISYMAQGAFKETLLGMLLVAFALGLRDVAGARADGAGRPPARTGVALGALAAGAVSTYSYPGAAWPVAIAGLFVLVELLRRPRAALTTLRCAIGPAVVAIVIVAVLSAPQAQTINTFATSSFAHEPITGHGNLPTALPAAETLGVWLTSDFRFAPDPYQSTHLLYILAFAALLLGLLWWGRRRDAAVLAGLAGAAIVAWRSHETRSLYNTAKALAILAPLVTLLLAPPLAAAWVRARGRDWGRPPRRVLLGAALGLARVTGVVLLVAFSISTFLALRDAAVGTDSHSSQLERLAALVPGKTVLFMGVDDFTQWELRGTRVTEGRLPYAPAAADFWPLKGWGPGGPIDIDNFSGKTLDGFSYLVTTSAHYRSTSTPNFVIAARTHDYLLWRRTHHTPARTPFERGGSLGGRLDCASPRGRMLVARGGTAVVVPAPLSVEQSEWKAQPSEAGQSVTQAVTVPAGTWDISLQYVSDSGFDFDAGDLHVRLEPTLDRFGAFFPVGRLHQPKSGLVTIRMTARQLSSIGKLLGAPAFTRALNSRNNVPLGRLALTRHGVAPRFVPISQACGQFVDWFQVKR